MKITIDRSVVKKAMEALTHGCPPDCKDGMTDSGGAHPWGEPVLIPCPNCESITALRAALAEPQEDQQPAGIVIGFTDEGHAIVEHDGFTLEEGSVLYLAPPHKTQPEPVQETIKRSQDWHDGVIEGHLRERDYWLAKQAEPVQEPCNPSCAPGYCYCAVQQAHPVQEPQRKPLSEEDIERITDEHWPDFVAFARAVEEAHGIK